MRREPELVAAALREIDAAQRRRQSQITERPVNPAAPMSVQSEGRTLVNFCSNDYLGLSQHPDVIDACQRALAKSGVGSGAAHLLGGHSPEHAALEVELAAFTGRQRALLFSTGYMANLGVISSFAARGEVVLQDRLNHASLIDAAKLSDARLLRYAHADSEAAGAMLDSQPSATLLATDGVFSMDGDSAPLASLAASCERHHTWMLVDDAHGIGVLGANGAGSLQAAQLNSTQVPLLMGTLGKALGCFGAFVAGDSDVIDLLLQRARSYIYTTAMPPALAAAARASVKLCRDESWRREQLQQNIRQLRELGARLGLQLLPSATAIQPLVIGDSARALTLGRALRSAGFLLGVTRPPTVPDGSARLRITLSTLHQPAQIEGLLNALDQMRALWAA
jgi:8-amino-7-oxononanoate synthase